MMIYDDQTLEITKSESLLDLSTLYHHFIIFVFHHLWHFFDRLSCKITRRTKEFANDDEIEGMNCDVDIFIDLRRTLNFFLHVFFLISFPMILGIVVQVMTSLTLNSEGFIPVLANVSPSGNRLKKKNLVDQTVFQIFEAISLIICERSQDDQGNETFRALSSQIDYFQRIVQFLFELSEQMLLRGQTLLEASSHVNQFNQEIFESQLIRILTAISCVFKHIPKPSFHNFPQAFQLISSLLQKLLENPHSQRAEGVRLKIITILHFYMTSLELGYYQSFLPHFGLMIRTVGSIREMESLTQLLIQLMSTHPKDVTRPLLLDCYEIVTQACLHFNSNFERLLMSQTLSFEHEISAVENDRGLTFRILLNFHQQIMATRLDELFLSSFGRSTPQDLSQLFILIPGIFNEMSPTSLKLQRSSCVPLKRLCCTLVNSFISNWLISPDSPQLVSESTRSIIGLLETFLHERWLPLLIVNLSPGFILRSSRSQQLQQLVKQSLAPSFPGGLLNCKDAATQPVIGEIATTFFFLFFRTEGALMEGAKPSDSFVVYITGLLQQLEWPPEYQQLFFNLLIVKGSSSSSHLTTYKENFLKFARSLPT